MDKIIKDQILGTFAKYNFDHKNFRFLKVKDQVYKLSYNNKFITYLEVAEGGVGGQSKNWRSFRQGLAEFTKKVVDGEKNTLYDVVCLINIIDGPGMLAKCIEGLIRQTKEPMIVLLVSNHEERQWAVDNNVDYFWTNERGSYEKISSGANYIRSTYREVKNLMICNSHDIFQDNWIHECYNLIKKKFFIVVGSPVAYVLEKDVNYQIEIDQEYAKNVLPNKDWQDVCFFNGIVINRTILNKIDWEIGSGTFNSNISFGIHHQLHNGRNEKACQLTNRYLVSIFTEKSTYNVRELKSNKCYKVRKIDILPPINSYILKQLNVPVKESNKLVVVPAKTNIPDTTETSSTHNSLSYGRPPSVAVREASSLIKLEIPAVKKVEIPIIMRKKEEQINSPKLKKRKVIAPSRNILLDDEETKRAQEEEEKRLEKEKKKHEEFERRRKEREKREKAVYQLKSHNKIMTIILNRNSQAILDLCLKALNAQLLETDILVITSHKGISQFLDKIKIPSLITNNNNDDKLDILEALSYIKKMNPIFVTILFDNDIIAPDWIREMHAHIKKNQYDVIGKNNGFVYDKNNNELFVKNPKVTQLNHIPPGFRKKWSIMNGKMIYNSILHKVNWDIFMNNKDIDLDISFMNKLIDNGAKFGRMKRSNIITVIEDHPQNSLISRPYLDVDNVKIADYIPMNDLYNVKELFSELLENYKINFTRKSKPKYKPITVPDIVTNISSDLNINILAMDGYEDDDFEYEEHEKLSESNRIVQGLWIGDSLGIFEQLCIISFMRKGHVFHLYSYGGLKGVPKGCILKDASEILPKEEIFYYSEKQSLSGKRTPVAFSNMFRYKMLYDKGGYWVDMDMICMKPFNFTEDYVFSSERGQGGEQTVNAGVIKCPVGSNFALYCYNVCVQKDKTQIKWGELGPSLVQDGIRHYGLGKFVKSPETFCPIGYDQINSLLDPYTAMIEKSWYGVHLWNEIWRKQRTDKNSLSFSFIVEALFGVKIERIFNKSGVFINWLPLEQMINTLIHGHEEKVFDCSDRADLNNLDQFIDNDIYIDLMQRLREHQIISDIHIILATKKDNRDNYSNKFNLFNGIYHKHRDIHFWRVHNLSDLTFIKNATLIFNRGRYDKLYRQLNFDSSTSFIINYPATAMNQMVVDGKIVDDSQSYRSSFPYDVMFIDEVDKHQEYRLMYPKTTNFVSLHKKGFDNITVTQNRPYDIVYCGSTMYPTKNSNLFLDYLNYLSKNKIHMKICIVSKFDDKMPTFNYLQIDQKNNVSYENMKTLFCQSKNNLIMSGRDANPRVISEALSCGCYCICLDTLSDGYSIFKERPLLGTIIPTHNKYLAENSSACCKPSDDLFDRITNEVMISRDAHLIAETFSSYLKRKYDQQITKVVDLYRKSNKGVYVLTLATEDYTKPLNYLLSSIRHSNPTLTVVAILVNCRDKLIQEFSEHYPRYRFVNYQINKNYTKGMILKLKVKLQRYFFKRYEKPFLWIDADSIVTKSLNRLLYNLWEYNMMVYTRFNEENHFMKFAVGVIGFGVGHDVNATKDLLDAYYKEVQTTQGINNWFYDQIALWEVYQNIKKTLKVYELKEADHTLDCNINSVVISRRRKKETAIREILDKNHCVVAEINFEGVPTMYEY